MKVAVLLSGQFRNSYEQCETIKKNLIDLYNADVFIYYTHNGELDIKEKDLINLYNPIHIEFEKYPNKINELIHSVKEFPKADESNTTSIFYMWYGIMKANELKIKYENDNSFKYDLVVRCRFDTHILNPVKLKNINNSIFIPIGSDHRGGCNDLFAYGKSDTMNYYTSLFNNLVDYIKDGELIHPEILLKHHLDRLEFVLIRTSISLRLRGILVNEIDYRIK
jgi:hypothetical protein